MTGGKREQRGRQQSDSLGTQKHTVRKDEEDTYLHVLVVLDTALAAVNVHQRVTEDLDLVVGTAVSCIDSDAGVDVGGAGRASTHHVLELLQVSVLDGCLEGFFRLEMLGELALGVESGCCSGRGCEAGEKADGDGAELHVCGG